MVVAISQRLFSSDVRVLACRVSPDPGRSDCAKERVFVDGVALWLCPKRVAVFLSEAGGSLAGLRCDRLGRDG